MATPFPQTDPASSPAIEYSQEVRFAVVMYGGVSLAIYINGIAQELLRMVRSTAQDAKGDNALLYHNGGANGNQSDSEDGKRLAGTERVYRKLSYLLADEELLEEYRRYLKKSPAEINKTEENDIRKKLEAIIEENQRPIHARFVVDILSGTSAGGINGIFLAKALANGQNMNELQQLWIGEGDMERLINDARSLEPPLSAQEPPASLLNSQRMYLELLKAFDGMEKSNGKNPKASSPSHVDELDLFVTTTDLAGITLPIRLADDVVYERRHRNVLHFVYSKSGASYEAKDRNDFEAKFNPFLAYAARCTSAFPVAFEPMCLCDADDVLEQYGEYARDENCRSTSDQWQRFYKDYLNPAGVRSVKFPKRSFADGGYLDNKPFTYATETLGQRQADVPVKRKLLYIEPSPEHPEDQADSQVKPDAIENVGAALLSLPRYETIREDLQRVLERNRLIERVSRIVNGVEHDVEEAHKINEHQSTDEEWSKFDLAKMIKERGPGYVAYQRLEIASVTDELARLVTRVAGFDVECDYFLVVRSLTRAWRMKAYTQYKAAAPDLPTMNEFLFNFNISYPMRRINFLRAKIDRLYLEDYCENAHVRKELLEVKKHLNDSYKKLRRTARLLRSRQVPPPGTTQTESAAPVSPVYSGVMALKAAIQEEVRRRLPDSSDPILDYFLGKRSNGRQPSDAIRIEDECDSRAEKFLKENPTISKLFDSVAHALTTQIVQTRQETDRNCRAALGISQDQVESTSGPPDPSKVREHLGYYYNYYNDHDMITFPILYGTDMGEAAPVEIIRVSPEDAKALINERQSGCRKLAGTALGHFGAFLDRLWRRNDILWGRLDGAERIVTALLPNDPQVARQLIGEAHAAIILETIAVMGEQEARDLLCESSMRTASGDADPELLGQFIKNLKDNDAGGNLNLLIEDRALRQHYINTFAVRSRLDPQSTLETAARATTVIGKILSTTSSRRNVNTRYTAWLSRLGQIFWSLVEVAVPRSIPNLLFRHWLKLLYFFEVALIAGSTLLLNPPIQKFGLLTFGITVAINFAVWILGDIINETKRWQSVLKALAIIVVVVFVVLGVVLFAAMIGMEGPWKLISSVHGWYEKQNPSEKLTTRVVISLGFIGFFLWAIREDLRGWWRHRSNEMPITVKNVESGSFVPIRINPIDEEVKKNVRTAGSLFFWQRKRCLIPFTLSAQPPKEWSKIFEVKWKEKPRGAKAYVTGTELRFVCPAANVEAIFQRLKETVSLANMKYEFLFQKAKDQAQAKKRKAETRIEKEPNCQNDINPILDNLDYR